ncbi:hypothetical protein GCM10023322_70070 [Rugosimonospora acidiphila]|uniref:ATP-grasp target RiPP n=1 Tax=Rugosimonospora acidiphila TaxID=556531 RepID=A0ABP9SMT6_9ACTN
MAEPLYKSNRIAGDVEDRAEKMPSMPPIVAYGRLPVSEFAYDRPGAASPFGDDQRLPLPHERITYVHPSEDDDTQVHL